MQIPYYEGQNSYGYVLLDVNKELISSNKHDHCYIFILKYDYRNADISCSDFFKTFYKTSNTQRTLWLHKNKCNLERLDWFIRDNSLIIYLLGNTTRCK